MSERFSLEQIREHWKQQALKHGQSASASWSEHPVIEAEIREILKHLTDGDRVLDAGCANGYSTVQFASQKKIDIRGVDYIQEMITQAQARLEHLADKLRGTVAFAVGDVTALDDLSDTYDKVIVTRVLINLKEWQYQEQALRECARVLKPGGLLILADGTVQGWQKMNSFRREWGLPEIPMPAFNQYLDEDKLLQAGPPSLRLVEISNYLSTYYVGTRVLKPLLIRALGADIDVANTDMEWNRWFAQLPPWGDYGTSKLFVFEKA